MSSKRAALQHVPADAPRLARSDAPPGAAVEPSAAPIEAGPAGSALLHLRDLNPLERNARKRTQRSSGMLAASLQEFGAARSIVIDENNVVLAGNGTVDAAGEVGIERVRVVEADGHELIAVRRSGLSDAAKARYALADNRAAELAEWDPDAIRLLLADDVDLTGLWGPEELTALLGNFVPATEAEQGRLDQKAKVTCPSCGHEFAP